MADTIQALKEIAYGKSLTLRAYYTDEFDSDMWYEINCRVADDNLVSSIRYCQKEGWLTNPTEDYDFTNETSSEIELQITESGKMRLAEEILSH